MEFKKGLLAVLLMAQSLSMMGSFVDPHESMNNEKWKDRKGERILFYTLLNDPQSDDPAREACIQELVTGLFQADPNYLIENGQELLHKKVPKEAFSQVTVFATNLVARDDINQVHRLEQWTLMHLAAYHFFKHHDLCQKYDRQRLPEEIKKMQAIIAFVAKDLNIPLTTTTKYQNWQPHNIYDVFASDVTVTPGDVVNRFSEEGDSVRALFRNIS